MHDILPYIDQAALYSQFDTYMNAIAGNSALGFPQLDTVISTLMCSSARRTTFSPAATWAGGSYRRLDLRVNIGSEHIVGLAVGRKGRRGHGAL